MNEEMKYMLESVNFGKLKPLGQINTLRPED